MSEEFAFLFLSSQMARPLSTPSPSQMQARKKRRGVSVSVELPNRGLLWVPGVWPGEPWSDTSPHAKLPGFKS